MRCQLLRPYKQQFDFSGETQAYAKFTEHGGFDAYCDTLNKALANDLMAKPVLFVGFSAGGAALWKVLSERVGHTNSHLIAFYPGQIRRHLSKQPTVNTSIVFPKLEQHFDLSAVIEYLVTKPALNLIQNKFLHGYANPSSENYHSAASQAAMDVLCNIDVSSSAQKFCHAMTALQDEHKLLGSE